MHLRRIPRRVQAANRLRAIRAGPSLLAEALQQSIVSRLTHTMFGACIGAGHRLARSATPWWTANACAVVASAMIRASIRARELRAVVSIEAGVADTGAMIAHAVIRTKVGAVVMRTIIAVETSMAKTRAVVAVAVAGAAVRALLSSAIAARPPRKAHARAVDTLPVSMAVIARTHPNRAIDADPPARALAQAVEALAPKRAIIRAQLTQRHDGAVIS